MTLELVRVDDRLIHGQITLKWSRTIGANLIVVANDSASKDPTRKTLMRMAAPSGVDVEVLSVEDTAQKLTADAWSKKKVLLLVRDPIDLLELVEGGVELEHVNVGNAGGGQGKIRLTKQIHADPDEMDAWIALDERGIDLEQQWLPGESKADLNAIIRKKKQER